MRKLSSTHVIAVLALGLLALGVLAYAVSADIHPVMLLVALPLLTGLLRWPHVALALFLHAGALKGAISIGPDLTVALAVIIAVALVRTALAGGLRRPPRPMWVFLAFGLVLIVGLIGSPGGQYGVTKALRFVGLSSVAVLGALQFVDDRRTFLQFVYWVIGISALIATAAVLQGGDLDYYGRYAAFGGDTIALGRAASLGLVSCVTLMWWHELRTWIGAGLSITFVLALLGSGNRAGVVAAIVAMVLGLVVSRAKTGRASVVFGVLTVVLGLIAPTLDVPESSLGKLRLLLSDGLVARYSVSRSSLVLEAIRLWWSRPILGVGTGGYNTLGSLVYRYPHNAFAEVLAENGVVGLLMYSGPIMWALVRSLRRAVAAPGVVTVLVLQGIVITLINAMVASDINGHRMLYVFMVFALVEIGAPLESVDPATVFLRRNGRVSDSG